MASSGVLHQPVNPARDGEEREDDDEELVPRARLDDALDEGGIFLRVSDFPRPRLPSIPRAHRSPFPASPLPPVPVSSTNAPTAP